MVRHARVLVLVAAACLAFGAASALAASGGGVPVLTAISVGSGGSGPVLHVRTSGHLETVAYSPQPGVWLVEMPQGAFAELPSVSAPDLGITDAEVAEVEEFGKKLTRLTVNLERPMAMTLEDRPDGFDLVFSGAETPVAPSQAVEPAPASTPPQEGTVSVEPVGQPKSPASGPVKNGGDLLAVHPVASSDGVVVRMEGNGTLDAHAFRLPNPERIVVDLPGVVCRVKRHVIPVENGVVRRVRVAQHRAVPEPVTRLVVDLNRKADYSIVESSDGAVLTIGSVTGVPDTVVASAAPEAPAPAESTVTTGSGEAAPVRSLPAGTIEIKRSKTAAAAAPLEGGEDLRAVAGVQPPAVEKAKAPAAPATPVAAAPAPASNDPFTADESQLVERAAAAQELDLPSPEQYQTHEVQTEEKHYTGEPISLRLKDADITDVLRTFAELTGLNIVVDPGVSGSVTVELHDVPWDQALDLILKINGLDYVLENNVLRVAPVSKLASEKAAQAHLSEQQEMTKPLRTVVKPLSYARASEASAIITKDGFLLSQRGSVIVDKSTNTLIIRDTVDRVDGILKLIAQLDKPVPQVMIEARIVETTRNFSHKLGINWGFSGVMDAQHGNDTGLNFPNSINVDGGVNLGLQYEAGGPRSAGGMIGFSFGDILNTFNLDFMLTAAESDGLVRIVSSPRVLAQNMQKATIRSGLQLPVQTVANNTVTVQYVDATLSLDVTPQITAEGTVMLDLKVAKREPLQAFLVQNATNAPISTRDASTKLLVRDGGTTVIGGIYQVNDQTTNNKVAGLGDIPIIGALFRSKEINKRHDELLIFITPRIVKY